MKEHANAVVEGGCSVMRLAETAAAARGGPDPKVAEMCTTPIVEVTVPSRQILTCVFTSS